MFSGFSWCGWKILSKVKTVIEADLFINIHNYSEENTDLVSFINDGQSLHFVKGGAIEYDAFVLYDAFATVLCF